jgi:nickel/cobalt exporter
MVIALGGWILWTQRHLLRAGLGIPTRAHGHHYHHSHEVLDEHEHAHAHAHGIEHSHPAGLHSHGWGTYHAHRIDLVTDARPKIAVLLALGVAGGLLPCPSALVVLLAAVAQHQVPLGIGLILVFSLGLAATLTCLGLVVVYAQRLGARLNVPGRVTAVVPALSSLAIVAIGVVMTLKALPQVA